MTTMGLGGLWHGASLNFVVWGLYHGVLLVGDAPPRCACRCALPRVVAVLVTFALVMFGWVFFRLHSAAAIAHDDRRARRSARARRGPRPRLALLVALACAWGWSTNEERTWRFDGFGVAAHRERRGGLRDRRRRPSTPATPSSTSASDEGCSPSSLAVAALSSGPTAALDWWIDPFGSFAKTGRDRRRAPLRLPALAGARRDAVRRVQARALRAPADAHVRDRLEPNAQDRRAARRAVLHEHGDPERHAGTSSLRVLRAIPQNAPPQTVYLGVEAFWFNPAFKGPPRNTWYDKVRYLVSASTVRASLRQLRARALGAREALAPRRDRRPVCDRPHRRQHRVAQRRLASLRLRARAAALPPERRAVHDGPLEARPRLLRRLQLALGSTRSTTSPRRSTSQSDAAGGWSGSHCRTRAGTSRIS